MKSKTEELKKIKLLVTIVPKGKKEIITDLLEEFEVNFSFVTNAMGTSKKSFAEILGLNSEDRDIIFSFIRSERVNDAILALEDKFKKFKANKSIAFSIPLASIIGIENYLFLANLGGGHYAK